MDKEKNLQCESTQGWRIVRGVIQTIVSDRNRPNPFGIKHRFGKRKGQLKKNKLVTIKEMEQAIAETKV